MPPVRSRCNASCKLATFTFPMLARTGAFTNPRLSKIKFVSAVADLAEQGRFPFMWHVTKIVVACLKIAPKCSTGFCTRQN
jgi:hypothetical protein